ncbi:MAG TPA: hypothetical protein PLJ21_01050 [Pseudobdellovibrionaceae bacterium]|nr:hypothetical protein [Pseudobdellovibrionaceae bacterium]
MSKSKKAKNYKKINKRALKKTLLQAAQISGRKKKETWLLEICEFEALIREAYFLGASRLLILKGLHEHGFKIPKLVFADYFNTEILSKKKVSKKPGVETNTDQKIEVIEKVQTSTQPQSSLNSRRKRKKGEFRIANDNL